MDSSKLIDLIEELSNLPEKHVESRSFETIQSLSHAPDCNRCQALYEDNKQLRDTIETSSSEYNSLLRRTKNIIDLYYEVFESQQSKFE